MADQDYDEDEQPPPTPNLRPVRRALAPSYYYGRRHDDPQTFIASFEQIAEANSWTEAMKLVQFPSYLRGFAQSWMLGLQRQVRRGDTEAPNWEELVRLFLRQATEGIYDDSEEMQLHARKQREDESLLGYLYSKDAMCDRVNPEMEEEKRIAHIKKGLLSKYFKTVNLMPITTMEQMRQLFTRMTEAEDKCKEDDLAAGVKGLELFQAEVDTVDKKREGGENPVLVVEKGENCSSNMPALGSKIRSHTHGRGFENLESEGMEVAYATELRTRLADIEHALVMSANQNNRPNQNGYPRVPQRREPPRLPPPIQCWRCGRLGHYASECRQPRQDGNQGGSGSRAGTGSAFNPDRRSSFLAQSMHSRGRGNRGFGPVFSADRNPGGPPRREWVERREGRAGGFTEYVWNHNHPNNHLCRICGKNHPLNRCSFRLDNPPNGGSLNSNGRDQRNQGPSGNPAHQ